MTKKLSRRRLRKPGRELTGRLWLSENRADWQKDKSPLFDKDFKMELILNYKYSP